MVTAIEGAGTAESAWLPWLAALALPPLPPLHRPLVVAPHPDDEVLGAAGVLTRDGAEIVAVTDGDASHPGVPGLAALRVAETVRALAVLGVPAAAVHRLGQPDGAVDEPALTRALCDLLAPGRPCLVTWRGDGHPDHEAAGRAAAAACARRGAPLLEYPVWAWHWAGPADPRVPWASALRLDLPPAVHRAKRAALREFRTQIPSILPPHVLARFERPYEIVFAA